MHGQTPLDGYKPIAYTKRSEQGERIDIKKRGEPVREKINARQRKFAEYYAQSGNTVQSAIKAGYSESYAKSRAHEMLENVGVAEYIKKLSEQAQNDRIMTAKERQALLSGIAKDNKNLPADRIRAVDTLNKMTGEYTTKIQAEVKASEKLSDVFAQIGGEGLEE